MKSLFNSRLLFKYQNLIFIVVFFANLKGRKDTSNNSMILTIFL